VLGELLGDVEEPHLEGAALLRVAFEGRAEASLEDRGLVLAASQLRPERAELELEVRDAGGLRRLEPLAVGAGGVLQRTVRLVARAVRVLCVDGDHPPEGVAVGVGPAAGEGPGCGVRVFAHLATGAAEVLREDLHGVPQALAIDAQPLLFGGELRLDLAGLVEQLAQPLDAAIQLVAGGLKVLWGVPSRPAPLEHGGVGPSAMRPPLEAELRAALGELLAERGDAAHASVGFGGQVRERGDDRVGVDGAMTGLLREELVDEAIERGRDLRDEVADARRRGLEVVEDEARHRLGLEGRLPRDHLEDHDAEGVEVAAREDVALVAEALGRHVARAPEELAGAGEARVVRGQRDPEVDDLHDGPVVLAAAHEDVLGLHVAVDDAEVVGAAEPARDLQAEHDDLLHREALSAEQALVEGLALEELHGEEGDPLVRETGVVELDDVGVREGGGALRLATEALAQELVVGEAVVEDLHRDVALPGGVVRAVDGRHPAAAEDLHQRVAAGDGLTDAWVGDLLERRAVDEAVDRVVVVTQPTDRTNPHAGMIQTRARGGPFAGDPRRGDLAGETLPSMRAYWWLPLLAACDCGGGGGAECTTSADCPAGEVCLDGTCTERSAADAGPDANVARPDAGGFDAQVPDAGPEPEDAGADTSCGSEAIAIDYRPPNVLVVFDRSCSMRRRLDDTSMFGTGPDDGRTRWATARDAVMGVVRTFEPRIFWGLMAYPDPREACGDDVSPEVAPMPRAADAIEAELRRDAIQPFGLCGLDNSDTTTQPRQTPTYDALRSAAALESLSDPMRPSFVLLVTDGGESCVGDGALMTQAEAMVAAGIPVAVVGFATGSTVSSLETLATSGGLPRAGGPPSYYVASDGDALEAVFAELTASFVSCTIPLSEAPPDGERVYVIVDDESLSEDGAEGYTYDADANTVTLNGEVCDRLRAGEVTRINVSFGCPDAPCMPQPEVCNGLDEDCDDTVDEDCLL